MGVAPLPFDPRSPCFCRQNCLGFRAPTSRWWLVWTAPPPSIPEIGTGLLVDFSVFIAFSRLCIFTGSTLPVGVNFVTLEIQPIAPIPGPTMRRQCLVSTNVGTSQARNFLDNEKCDIPLNIPGVVPNNPFGDCNIFPVRWFENANDVPH